MNIIPAVFKEDSDKQRQKTAVKQQKEYKKIGSALKVPGHTLFSYNKVTGEIKPAPIENGVKLVNASPVTYSNLLVEKDCYYEQALNEKNFIKRLKRNGIIND